MATVSTQPPLYSPLYNSCHTITEGPSPRDSGSAREPLGGRIDLTRHHDPYSSLCASNFQRKIRRRGASEGNCSPLGSLPDVLGARPDEQQCPPTWAYEGEHQLQSDRRSRQGAGNGNRKRVSGRGAA